MNKLKTTVFDLALIAVLTGIIFIQEELLTAIPNVQLTVFLIVLFSKKLGFWKTSVIVILHTVLDNLYMGSFNIYYFPAMLIGWLLIPCVICTICRKIDNSLILAIVGAIMAVIYCWCFIPITVFVYHMNFKAYFIADLPFEGILALSSFLSILILYRPLSNALDIIYKKNIKKSIEELHE